MKNLYELNQYRLSGPEVLRHYGNAGDETCGLFEIPNSTGAPLRVIASSGEGWDHVSVSLPNRCPNWPEMERVKRMFFNDHETAMQLHVPPADHLSLHPYCLHLWRPLNQEIPRPHGWMVAPEPVAESATTGGPA